MSGPLLTLEPLMEAVRTAVEAGGWHPSGIQKTTSTMFEGRWDGDSTRSAYLFFHREADGGPSLDVFLDETTRGLSGNLALVLDGPTLGDLAAVHTVLTDLLQIARAAVPAELDAPISFRLRLEHDATTVDTAEVEVRFKVSLPRTAIDAGPRAVGAVVRSAVEAFEAIRADPRLGVVLPGS